MVNEPSVFDLSRFDCIKAINFVEFSVARAHMTFIYRRLNSLYRR